MDTERQFVFGNFKVRTLETGRQMSSPGVIIFLHGRYSDADSWQPLAGDLKSRFKCVAVDFPEKSNLWEQVALVQALIARLVFEGTANGQVLLVGHDVGGAIALAAASLRPIQIAGIVLINAISLANEQGSIAFEKGWFGYKQQTELKRWLYFSPALSNQDKVMILKNWRRSKLFGSEMKGAWPLGESAARWKKKVATLSVPTLLLWGAGRSYFNVEDPSLLGRNIYGADTYFHETAGHWLQLERPEWVAYKIREFAFRSSREELRSAV